MCGPEKLTFGKWLLQTLLNTAGTPKPPHMLPIQHNTPYILEYEHCRAIAL